MNGIYATKHACERFVERVADPSRYEHLSECNGCQKCHSLITELRRASLFARRGLNTEITERVRASLQAGNKITDHLLIEAAEKHFKRPSGIVEYYFDVKNSNVVYVLAGDGAVLTVLTREKIDGFLVKKCDTKEDEMRLLRHWKRTVNKS